jgi:hypothetical protein
MRILFLTLGIGLGAGLIVGIFVRIVNLLSDRLGCSQK